MIMDGLGGIFDKSIIPIQILGVPGFGEQCHCPLHRRRFNHLLPQLGFHPIVAGNQLCLYLLWRISAKPFHAVDGCHIHQFHLGGIDGV